MKAATYRVLRISLVHHDDGAAVHVIDEPPEIHHGVGQRHLSDDEGILLVETL